MQRTHRFIASFVLIAGLATPAIMAAPKVAISVRVYDKGHKDYHNWDDHENQAWSRYRTENHLKVREFSKADKKEQSRYWNWRHSHPD